MRFLKAIEPSRLGEKIVYHASEDALPIQCFLEGTNSESFFKPRWLETSFEVLMNWLLEVDTKSLDPIVFSALLFEIHIFIQATQFTEFTSETITNLPKKASKAIAQLQSLHLKVQSAMKVLHEIDAHWEVDSDSSREVIKGLYDFQSDILQRIDCLKANSPLAFTHGKFRPLKGKRYCKSSAPLRQVKLGRC